MEIASRHDLVSIGKHQWIIRHAIDLDFERRTDVIERVANRPDSVALTDVHIDGNVDVVLQIEPGRDEELVPGLEQVEQQVNALT